MSKTYVCHLQWSFRVYLFCTFWFIIKLVIQNSSHFQPDKIPKLLVFF